jgi:hypothetical protein
MVQTEKSAPFSISTPAAGAEFYKKHKYCGFLVIISCIYSDRNKNKTKKTFVMVAVGFLLVKKNNTPFLCKNELQIVCFYAIVRVPNIQAGCQNKEYHLQNSSIVF